MRTPERRTLTGWRCRISEPRTARTRVRVGLGMPTRKTDFQTCELTMPSWTCFRVIVLLSPSHFQKRIRIRPLSAFLVELHRFVDDDLAVRRVDEDFGPLEGPRRRAFEVDAGPVVAAA